MPDPRFFDNAGPFTLARIAEAGGAEISSDCDPERRFSDIVPLDVAGADEVSFLDNPKYIPQFKKSAAGACIVAPKNARHAPAGMVMLISPTPYHAFARVASLFYPVAAADGRVHPSARIDATAKVDPSADIDTGVVVEAGAEIGPGCRIGANTYIGRGVVLAENVNVGPNVTIQYAIIGSRTTIHPGTRIGQDGFGFAPGAQGHEKVPQLGRVLIGEDVEIGANTAIDRGTGPDTVIGSGTKIDNLVQIGHNVKIGAHCLIAGQVGMAGSTEIGDFVAMAGQVGIAGHLKIGAGARIGAQAGVMQSLPPRAEVSGTPAQPFRQWLRQSKMLERWTKTRGN
jgi:UDP-3-O-[3-hydroxymyristoyl] glucosamine N-acyltransferase